MKSFYKNYKVIINSVTRRGETKKTFLKFAPKALKYCSTYQFSAILKSLSVASLGNYAPEPSLR